MAEKKKIYPNPQFANREQEDKYWAEHSPLTEGIAGTVQKEKQKRSSFLTIRLTGDELTLLRDLAATKGMGPSTFIRSLIKDALHINTNIKQSVQFEVLQPAGALNQYVREKSIKAINTVDVSAMQSMLMQHLASTITPEFINRMIASAGTSMTQSKVVKRSRKIAD